MSLVGFSDPDPLPITALFKPSCSISILSNPPLPTPASCAGDGCRVSVIVHMAMILSPQIYPRKPSLQLPLPKTSFFSRHSFRPQNQIISFPSPVDKIQTLGRKCTNIFPGLSREISWFSRKSESSSVRAGNGVDEVEIDRRGESTMPDRFRYLTKEAPDPPVRWPWFVAMVFLLYTWRAVLFELSNWRKGVFTIIRFVGYLSKLVLAVLFHFIGDPVTSMIRGIETALYTVRSFYSSIVAYAPVQDLTTIILLASAVLAIADASVPNVVNDQPYTVTICSLIGYAAVKGYISEPVFWTILFGVYSFSRFVKKRDDVSSAMPVAAVMAGIGEPWVRVLVMISYLGLAISHRWKKVSKGKEEEEEVTSPRPPLPLLATALAIGIHVAAKSAGYRHLTWMIV